jgi:hypothetical protein
MTSLADFSGLRPVTSAPLPSWKVLASSAPSVDASVRIASSLGTLPAGGVTIVRSPPVEGLSRVATSSLPER